MDLRQKYFIFFPKKTTSHYSEVFFLYLLCLPFSSCQFTLHLWDFCSLRATTDNSLGISVRAIVCRCLWVRKKNGTNLILKLSTTLPGVVNTVGTAEPAVRENCNQCIPMHQQGMKIKSVRQEEFSSGRIKEGRSKAVFPVHTFNCGGPPQINHHPAQISFLFLALPIFMPVLGNASDMFFALPLSMPVSIFNMPQHVSPSWHKCCPCDRSHSHS